MFFLFLNIKKQIWLDIKEDELLKRKSKEAGLSEAEFIRSLIKGYRIKAQPTEEIKSFQRDLYGIANNINQIAYVANSKGIIVQYNLEEEYRRKQEDEYNKEMTEKARNEIEKIAWNRHDINKMKYMLHTHRCTFCGTEAPEGSITFDFIKQRLADVMELLNPKSDSKRPEYKRLFKYRNIEELKEIGAAIKYTGKDIDGINDEIESKKEENTEK